MTFRKGDPIDVTCEGRTIDGMVEIISDNQVSVLLSFETILSGHVGKMPALLVDPRNNTYASIIDGTEVTISKKKLAS